MKKKIALGLGTLAVAVAVLPLFAAFEAHVINVTARIENALTVPIKFLNFGTVFPQEKLAEPIDITLSGSFLDENQDRVNEVDYFIRQKPKCAITWNNGQNIDLTVGQDGTHAYTKTGHIVLGDNPATDGVIEEWWIDCGPAPRPLLTQPAETWGVLPNLCPYISKHSEVVTTEPLVYEDGAINSFHFPWTINNGAIVWNDAQGTVSKPSDTSDRWMIDLAVPCFGGYCAQDWENFVSTVSGSSTIDASEFTQPIANEHKFFGCDLWVEVSDVSLAETP